MSRNFLRYLPASGAVCRWVDVCLSAAAATRHLASSNLDPNARTCLYAMLQGCSLTASSRCHLQMRIASAFDGRTRPVAAVASASAGIHHPQHLSTETWPPSSLPSSAPVELERCRYLALSSWLRKSAMTWLLQSDYALTACWIDPCTNRKPLTLAEVQRFLRSFHRLQRGCRDGVPRSLNYPSVHLKAHLGSYFDPPPLFLYATAAAELVKCPLTACRHNLFAFLAASPGHSSRGRSCLWSQYHICGDGACACLRLPTADPCRWYFLLHCFYLTLHLAAARKKCIIAVVSSRFYVYNCYLSPHIDRLTLHRAFLRIAFLNRVTLSTLGSCFVDDSIEMDRPQVSIPPVSASGPSNCFDRLTHYRRLQMCSA